MRAPSRLGLFRRRDSAEVGVGTLIVFIAMVLVAAVAAAVIIGTSGSLQQRAQQTGQESLQEVSSNVEVTAAYGIRNDTSTDIYEVKLLLTMAAASQDVDLGQMLIRYSDGDKVRIYKNGTSPEFQLTWIRGTGTDKVMKGGDLVELTFNTQEETLAPRTAFNLQLLPQVGAPVHFDVKTPSTYSSNTIVTLR